jgi:hypothetical protein
MSRIHVAVVVSSLALLVTCAACSSATPQASAEQTPAAAPAGEVYTPPAEGTASLVQSVTARKDTDGQVSVEGRLLLPAGTRVWVDVYPPGDRGADPIGRAELYLGPGGSFKAGPFKLPVLAQLQVQFTSHFSRSWQPNDVIALVGAGGMKLPKSALRPANPQSPQSGGFLETTVAVAIN